MKIGIGLNLKIITAFLAFELLAISILSYVFWGYGNRLLENALDAKGKGAAQYLARISAYPILAWNKELIKDSVRAVYAQEDCVGIEIVSDDGKVFYKVGSTREDKGVEVYREDVFADTRRFVDEEAVIGPLEAPSKRDLVGQVRVFLMRTGLLTERQKIMMIVIFTALGAFFLTSILGYLVLYGLIGRPLSWLVKGIKQVYGGDLSTEVKVETGDELEDLANWFNDMVKTVRSRTEKMVEEAKRTTQEKNLMVMGEFSAMLIHEVGNMLNRFSVIEYQIMEEDLGPKARELLQDFSKELRGIERFIENVRLFSKAPEITPKPLEVVSFLRGMLTSLRLINPKEIEYVFDPHCRECVAFADEDQMRRVILNLLKNATDATPPKGVVKVSVFCLEKVVRIAVSDTGPGIEEGLKDQIFLPFFTTKGPGGTGLGLAIVRSIVEAHGGTISFESQAGKGTTFFVEVPKLLAS